MKVGFKKLVGVWLDDILIVERGVIIYSFYESHKMKNPFNFHSSNSI